MVNLDAAALEIYEGGALSFPAVTGYVGTDNAVNTEWYVRGEGSRLAFPA
ncbi:MAG: hypothetical protein R2856_27600 [Caldilineaceae bacterium]